MQSSNSMRKFTIDKIHHLKRQPKTGHLLMKPIMMIVLLFCCTIPTQALDFFFSQATFQRIGEDPYIETYLAIPLNSLVYADTEGKGNQAQVAQVEVVTTFSKDGAIVTFDKYLLQSEPVSAADSMKLALNLLDTKRFILPVGVYDIEIQCDDLNNTLGVSTYKEKVEIKQIGEEIAISDIMILELTRPATATTENSDFSKNGLEMLPFVFPYYTDRFTKLKFYCEIYNTDKLDEDDFLLQYFVCKNGQNRPTKNLRRFKKEKASSVCAILGELDIKELNSGNYELVVQARDKKNTLLAEKRFFLQRNNSSKRIYAETAEDLELIDIEQSFVNGYSLEQLCFHVASLGPIVDGNQQFFIDNLLEEKNIEHLQRFLYNFWSVTDPFSPKDGFEKYAKVVNSVETAYATQNRRGYETDRGYYFLKYGKPNHILAKSDLEPGVYPYEIWQYYKMDNGQSNVKFVFVSQNPAANDYDLIHSDVRGEINEPEWQKIIDPNGGDAFGSRLKNF